MMDDEGIDHGRSKENTISRAQRVAQHEDANGVDEIKHVDHVGNHGSGSHCGI